MPIAVPNNVALLNNLTTKDKQRYDQYMQAMQRVEARNPGMDTVVYTAFLEHWLEGAVKHQDVMQDMIARARVQGFSSPPQQDMERESRRLGVEARNDFLQNKLPKYGAEGEMAFRELGKEMNPSIFGNITRNFYDKDEGGIQFGGFIGAALLGFLAFKTGGGLNNWMGIVAGLMGIIGGGWLGNKIGDWMGLSGKKESASPSVPSVGQARQQQPALSEDAQRRRDAARRAAVGEAPPASVTPAEQSEVQQNEGDLGTMPRPNVGGTAPDNAQEQGR